VGQDYAFEFKKLHCAGKKRCDDFIRRRTEFGCQDTDIDHIIALETLDRLLDSSTSLSSDSRIPMRHGRVAILPRTCAIE
jgi:hypothetical protein